MFQARKCALCDKSKGTMAFRYQVDGRAARNYYHPACFRDALRLLEATKDLDI
jgi:cephalosporin-C deacetylase-like acetyl esterase